MYVRDYLQGSENGRVVTIDGFLFRSEFFFRTTRVFFVREIIFQNLSLGYITKTLNQIIFFSSTKIRIFFSATLGIRIFFCSCTIPSYYALLNGSPKLNLHKF